MDLPSGIPDLTSQIMGPVDEDISGSGNSRRFVWESPSSSNRPVEIRTQSLFKSSDDYRNALYNTVRIQASSLKTKRRGFRCL
ncbi:hypothetical protein M405DRAFT_471503 [Rhizopogon salebrosus TDB-379]|nr:hypothetical protein M405DRAFT_471503 [Rhizopogon salebrosus TDB-379]